MSKFQKSFVGAVAALTVAAGCGSSGGALSGASASPTVSISSAPSSVSEISSVAPEPVDPPGSSHASLEKVSVVFYALRGTPEQQLRSVKGNFESTQSALQDCMSHENFDYVMPVVEFDGSGGAAVLPFWFVQPDRERAQSQAFGIVVGNPWQPVLADKSSSDGAAATPPNPLGYDPAMNKCTNFVESLHLEQNTQMWLAAQTSVKLQFALQETLKGEWFDSIRSKYSSCMTASGFTIDDPGMIADAFYSAVASGRFQGERGDVERALAVADADCRMPFSGEIADAVTPAFEKWMNENSSVYESVISAMDKD